MLRIIYITNYEDTNESDSILSDLIVIDSNEIYVYSDEEDELEIFNAQRRYLTIINVDSSDEGMEFEQEFIMKNQIKMITTNKWFFETEILQLTSLKDENNK